MNPATLFADHIALAHWLANRCHNPAGPPLEDLEQTALLALHVAAREFDPARGCRFSTFAAAVVRNALSRDRRHWRTFRPLPESAEPATDPGPEAARAEDAAAAETLAARLLPALPRPWRELVCRRYGIGSQRSTAGQLAAERGVSRQAVAQQLRRALRQLRAAAEGRTTRPAEHARREQFAACLRAAAVPLITTPGARP